MSRLADYFVVVGYDHSKARTGQQSGMVLQRFPQKDWDNCPFTPGIEMFCQPAGWHLTTEKMQPSFFVSVLTDTDAERHYCAVLTFSEDVTLPPTPSNDLAYDEEDGLTLGGGHVTKLYAPKSLVLVSRLSYFETFRNCLGLIYTVHIENNNVETETLIGNILGCIQVPPPGGPQIRFSIGAGDRQALQPPLCSTLPCTCNSVAMLFKHLGIHNSISVFCAALSDLKVLFVSQSFTRLTEASHALSALMYPLKYSYVYVPILPSRLLEVLSTPTPFIAGVHSSRNEEIADLLDVIIADLDGGSIHVPDHVQLCFMPSYVRYRMVHSLNLILHPELILADDAFLGLTSPKSSLIEMVDKEIRAVFLRFFAELLYGYRSCLTIVRIHDEPVIRFHKASFLGQRGLVEDEFTKRVLDSMSFNTFVAERGPPYRVCDIFDEVFASMQDVLKTEEENPERLLHNIQDLAQQLYHNECPNAQPYAQKIPKPTLGAHMRIHQPVFPHIDEKRTQEIIEEGILKHNLKSKLNQLRPQQPRIVPSGPNVCTTNDHMTLISTHARRLDVLRSCINYIFENKISDARKIFPAVLKVLKNKVARLAMVEEFKYYVQGNKTTLEHHQFDLIVRLLNCALQNESPMDENGIAAAILPLSHAFCRKLCTGVYQCAYTCIQEHAVWSSREFWEGTFYKDVEREIRQLYLPEYEEHLFPDRSVPSPKNSPELSGSYSRESLRTSGMTPESKRRSMMQHTASYRARDINALEIAAEQMRIWQSLPAAKQKEAISQEESTVYCQAIHYANRMVSLRVPLDATKSIRSTVGMFEGESMSSNVTNSAPESDSYDAESELEEQDIVDVSSTVIKFVNRFTDKVCGECGVIPEHLKSLHVMIPGMVDMHIEALERVHQEAKRLPPIQKPKIFDPVKLPGEDAVIARLRVYLVPDGREEGVGGTSGGPALLPAEGGLVLTTYRIIFKGAPCDPLVSEHTVCRSFPIASLTREKKVTIQPQLQLDQWLSEGLQLRSNTFQLMRIAFDEEVNPEHIEDLRKLLMKLRFPASVGETFAFASYPLIQTAHSKSRKEKHASLKGFAKKTLLKTARKAGLKPKESSRKPKLILQTPPMARRGLPGHEGKDRPISYCVEEELSVIDEQDISVAIQTDAKNVERLAERLYVRDFGRLGLGSLTTNQARRNESFRLTVINNNYSVCKSYPAVLVVPQSISDDSVRKFARSHRQYRFPVVTWRHPHTRAVLLRASGFHGKGVMEMLKGKPNAPAGGSTVEKPSTGLEQEKYFSALTNILPSGNSYGSSELDFDPISSSHSSLDSLAKDSLLLWDSPPEGAGRRPGGHNRISRVVTTFRNSGGKAKSLGRASSARARSSTNTLPTGYNHQAPKQNGTLEPGELADNVANSLHKAALYVLGEKNHVKAIRQESFPKCYFNPVDYQDVRHVKASFKKLMRACVPTAYSTDKGYLKAVEDSEWLPQLQNIMLIAGAVVDLMDGWGSSVMLCLEDGWDFTSQVISLAQLLLDPYYRTFEGFRTLIEKEWLSFGHRFTHRSNQTMANQASGFAPIFLQFLDVVHQVHRQFPLSFEFNQYYLKFLAYHHVSCRFRTFMMDNECERVEAGWLLEEHHRRFSMDQGSEIDTCSLLSERFTSNGTSIWDYIDMYNKRSPVFYNFQYSPMEQESVLRPYSNLANLHIWDYYLEEDLACGPSYDFESFAKEAQIQEGQDINSDSLAPIMGQRKVFNSCYHNIDQMMPDNFSYLMAEIAQLEQELGQRTEQWGVLWERLEPPSREQLRRQVSFNTHIVRSHGVSVHKRSTIEFLAKGKLGDPSKLFSQPHQFEKFSYTTPAYCDYCSHLLWGLAKTGMRCSDCGYNSHEKCVPHTPKNCTRMTLTEARHSAASIAQSNIAETSSIMGETRTHEGYLCKQGALLKGWKQRWFVLDSMKHQLRYYDSPEDSNCKGFIELADVEFVQAINSIQGTPKKAAENAFFEMKTIKRLYCFGAPDMKSAEEWVEKIQNSIQ